MDPEQSSGQTPLSRERAPIAGRPDLQSGNGVQSPIRQRKYPYNALFGPKSR